MEVRGQIIAHLGDWLEQVHSTETLYVELVDVIPEDKQAQFKTLTQFLIYLDNFAPVEVETQAVVKSSSGLGAFLFMSFFVVIAGIYGNWVYANF